MFWFFSRVIIITKVTINKVITSTYSLSVAFQKAFAFVRFSVKYPSAEFHLIVDSNLNLI